MNRFLEGRSALIVGGSGGIGAAVSVALARCGARLYVHGGHDRHRLERVVAQAREAGAAADGLLLELTGQRDSERLVEFAPEPDVLVCSFGPYAEGPVGGTSGADWERMVSLNLTLPAALISMVIPGMVTRAYGRIVAFGAPHGDEGRGYRRIAAYAAAKQGLGSLVRSVALQYAERNIRCNMICPGYVETEYYDRARAQTIAASQPGGRLISAAEIAGLVVHLLRTESDAVNGAIIPVDQGI